MFFCPRESYVLPQLSNSPETWNSTKQERDHCETSERAYSDIATLLTALAGELGKDAKELVIYDPYFCQGSVVERLASLGFPRVHNRNEDFYEVLAKWFKFFPSKVVAGRVTEQGEVMVWSDEGFVAEVIQSALAVVE